MKKDGEAIKLPILIPLFASILLLIIIFTIAIYRLQQKHINDDVQARLDSISRYFNQFLASDARLIGETTHFVKDNPDIQNAWLAKNRNTLLTLTIPIFEKLRQDYRITHLYFIDTNNTCFLRVHNPPRFGDRINRFTLKSAADTVKPYWGIELGPYGTFTLRVVQPWFVNNTLTGFIEFGEEIEHIAPQLKNVVNVDLAFLIDKSLLNRDDVESEGVGLTLTKKIVELYDGKIWLTSKLGVGSTFFFTLPKQMTAVSKSPQPAQT
ncbi:MAG: cache domain-containing protein [Sedimentisphaerales bacterium]|jgi:hypothetical protein